MPRFDAPWAAVAALMTASSPAAAATVRPEPASNRWQEDWSALADPTLRTEPFDRLKYIPLQGGAYLSFGATVRERIEFADGAEFGTRAPYDSYLLQRVQAHADVHWSDRWRAFVQVEDVRTFGKQRPTPTDRNPVDLRLAFVGYRRQVRHGTWMTRIGRQDFAFGQQRFLSLRDGPNVRQSFDGLWVRYETGAWEISGLVSQPVRYRADEHFDDLSKGDQRFGMLRAERKTRRGTASVFYARLRNDGTSFLDAAGREWRDNLDVHVTGTQGAWDWDAEGIAQSGAVGHASVRAWAAGLRGGYTFQAQAWTPRLGLQLDAASGDERPGDARLNTFNPLFPNGSYSFTLAGHTGYVNVIQVKPSLRLRPTASIEVSAAVAGLWRENVHDAVYVQPDLPLAGSAAARDRYTASYVQLHAQWNPTPQFSTVVELVHYDVGRVVRDAGGRDSDYAGLELKFSW